MRKLLLVLVLLSFFAPESEARMGGGRSFGSRGSRSVAPRYQAPHSQPGYGNRSATGAMPHQTAPSAGFGGGGFMRSLAGGLAGGMIGSMLFRSMGWAGDGMGGMGGGGFGLLEILLFAGIGFLIFRWVKKGRSFSQYSSASPGVQSAPLFNPNSFAARDQIDSSVIGDGEESFKEARVDDFFTLQAALMNRELTNVRGRMTPEMLRALEADIETLKSKGQINRIENIAVRETEIVEAWKEPQSEYATLRLKATLLDFTVDDKTGDLVGGSKEVPVKFDEYWTFARANSADAWKLSAIENNA